MGMPYDRRVAIFWPDINRMRLRIVHQLSLLLVLTVLAAVLAVGGLVAWNLRSGFSDYLRARDLAHLERFAGVVARHLATLPPDARRDPGRLPMRELVDEFARLEGLPGGSRPPPPRPDPPEDGPTDGKKKKGPPGPGPGGTAQRLQVVDPGGRRLGGPPFPPDRGVLETPVFVDGRAVAQVRMLPSPTDEDVDRRFLRRQYAGLAVAGATTLVLALLAAWFVAPRMSRPLRSVQRAAHRIAGGEFDVVVPEAGPREMAELIADVNRMAIGLRTLDGARRAWIAQIAHELRTPLSVLRGELEAIEDGARAPTPPVMAQLRAEVMRLVRLIGDLHVLSMADLGALPCEFADADGDALLHAAVRRHAARIAGAGLTLELEGAGAVRCRWDAGRIEQLVANLLENATRYTDAPGRVRVTWHVTQQVLSLRVDDSPPGVPSGQLDQIFDPLFRVDRARTRPAGDGGGSGLGLAIVRAIALAHHGTVRAEASPFGGLAVIVRLPLDAEGQ